MTDWNDGTVPEPSGGIRGVIRRMLPSGGHPARATMTGFASAIVVGTALLMLPVAAEGDRSTDFVHALFTATSAVCITGLTVVDTSAHWSTFGEVTIMVLIQLGGLGIMAFASLMVLLMSRRFGLRMQLTAQAETKSMDLGQVGRVVSGIVKISLTVELVTAAVLAARLVLGYDYPIGRALYHGLFHGVSSFNNAGFSLYPDNLMRFVADPWVTVPILIAVLIGGLGFPVVFELLRRLRGPVHWSLHTKITLLTSAALLVVGFALITGGEWSNPDTFGPLGVGTKFLAGLFAAVMPRSAGFNTVDIGAMNPETLLVHDVLMFIGGGSASTAAGIKVTTFALLAFVILAEIRGEPTVHVMGRRLGAAVQRQALTVALLAVGLVMTTTMLLLTFSHHDLDEVLFEAVSAVGTVGLSTGITAELPPVAHILMSMLMFMGRLGPITLATALALRDRPRRYELAEERPIVG